MMEERLYDRSDIPCLMIMCHSNLGHLRTERWILKEAGIESPTLIIGG